MNQRLFLLLFIAACARSGNQDSAANKADSLSIIAQFSGTESVQYYPAGEEYFVSNVNGDVTVKDDNGFISRVSPEGPSLI